MRRLFDITAACLGLILGAIPMAIIALLVRITDGSPVLFRQRRVGWHGSEFILFKFRTMRPRPGHNGRVTLGGNDHVTPVGCRLRAWHLDELPQLANVLWGDMSVIGPRPEVPEFVDSGSPAWTEVLRVRPGLLDESTLHWLHEPDILAAADDWEVCYREVILPDKLRRSALALRHRSAGRDCLLLWQLARALFARVPGLGPRQGRPP